jgi:preprotein translocase subunit SecE
MPDKKRFSFERIGTVVSKFFSELKSELKKVVWPDRKKLTQSTITVLSICLIMAFVVFAIDRVLAGTLGLVGFFPDTNPTKTPNNLLPTSAPVATATLTPEVSESLSESSDVESED